MSFEKLHVPKCLEDLPPSKRLRESAAQESKRKAINAALESAALRIDRHGRDNPAQRNACSACAQIVRDGMKDHPRAYAKSGSDAMPANA